MDIFVTLFRSMLLFFGLYSTRNRNFRRCLSNVVKSNHKIIQWKRLWWGLCIVSVDTANSCQNNTECLLILFLRMKYIYVEVLKCFITTEGISRASEWFTHYIRLKLILLSKKYPSMYRCTGFCYLLYWYLNGITRDVTCGTNSANQSWISNEINWVLIK